MILFDQITRKTLEATMAVAKSATGLQECSALPSCIWHGTGYAFMYADETEGRPRFVLQENF